MMGKKHSKKTITIPVFTREESEEPQIADAEDILTTRGRDWGDAFETHLRIAKVWSGILGKPVSVHEVALCMVGLKLVRNAINPGNEDSLVDADGYVRIAQQILGQETQ